MDLRVRCGQTFTHGIDRLGTIRNGNGDARMKRMAQAFVVTAVAVLAFPISGGGASAMTAGAVSLADGGPAAGCSGVGWQGTC